MRLKQKLFLVLTIVLLHKAKLAMTGGSKSCILYRFLLCASVRMAVIVFIGAVANCQKVTVKNVKM
jgi:hypothetical protein